MKVSIFFAWYYFWIGAYYDQNKRILYICPMPMIVIKFAVAHDEDSAQEVSDE